MDDSVAVKCHFSFRFFNSALIFSHLQPRYKGIMNFQVLFIIVFFSFIPMFEDSLRTVMNLTNFEKKKT